MRRRGAIASWLVLKLKMASTATMQTMKKMPKGVVDSLLSILMVYSCSRELRNMSYDTRSLGSPEGEEDSDIDSIVVP